MSFLQAATVQFGSKPPGVLSPFTNKRMSFSNSSAVFF